MSRSSWRKPSKGNRNWVEKLPFALWGYHTLIRTSIGATPYSLVYGIEGVLPAELRGRILESNDESSTPGSKMDQRKI
jgi:hypothetical protein